jgi:hypothetical protein
MASIWDFLDNIPRRGEVSPEELAARRQGYADLYAGGFLSRNKDEDPMSVRAMQASQDFIPGIGDAIAFGEAGQALSEGNRRAAALLAAGGMLGVVPGAGDALARPVIAAGRKVADAIPSDVMYAGRSQAEGDMRGALDAFAPGRPAQGLGADAVKPSVADLRRQANIERFGYDPNDVPTPVINDVESYAGSHRAPSRADDVGASLDNPTTMFGGDDIYTSNAARYFGHGDPAMDRESLRAINAARGNPNAEITVYRAIPKNLEGAQVNTGDWVTPSRAYAETHGQGPLRGDYQIIEQKVRAGDLFTEGDIHEWGYSPAAPAPAGLLAPEPAPGIRAYHGTPHEFPPAIRVLDKDTGKTYVQEMGDPVATGLLAQNPERYQIIEENPMGMFDFSKMGTGEGAQAYGWGGYLAEAKPVAVEYRDQLSGNPYGDRREIVMGGRALQDPTDVQWGMADAPDKQEYLNSLRSRLSDAEDRVKSATPLSAGDDLTDDDMDTLMAMSKRNSLAEKLAEAETLVDTDIRSKPLGQLYSAQINADPKDFIDWDAPLDKQTGKVAEYISNYEALTGQPVLEALPDRELTGKDLYTSLVGKEMRQRGIDSYNESTPFASAYLNAEGIPGIRHLDAGSRGAGEGSRNYVVFDENLISIVKKYGIAGAAAMLGASVADVEQAMASGYQQPQQGLLSAGAQ